MLPVTLTLLCPRRFDIVEQVDAGPKARRRMQAAERMKADVRKASAVDGLRKGLAKRHRAAAGPRFLE